MPQDKRMVDWYAAAPPPPVNVAERACWALQYFIPVTKPDATLVEFAALLLKRQSRTLEMGLYSGFELLGWVREEVFNAAPQDRRKVFEMIVTLYETAYVSFRTFATSAGGAKAYVSLKEGKTYVPGWLNTFHWTPGIDKESYAYIDTGAYMKSMAEAISALRHLGKDSSFWVDAQGASGSVCTSEELLTIQQAIEYLVLLCQSVREHVDLALVCRINKVFAGSDESGNIVERVHASLLVASMALSELSTVPSPALAHREKLEEVRTGLVRLASLAETFLRSDGKPFDYSHAQQLVLLWHKEDLFCRHFAAFYLAVNSMELLAEWLQTGAPRRH